MQRGQSMNAESDGFLCRLQSGEGSGSGSYDIDEYARRADDCSASQYSLHGVRHCYWVPPEAA
ncbi:hypothetical protein KTH_53260 [Thermosporothrix hazakensis]|nr:hypothetical protein KTH_53260 [Thermosporothrix hazakensis]